MEAVAGDRASLPERVAAPVAVMTATVIDAADGLPLTVPALLRQQRARPGG